MGDPTRPDQATDRAMPSAAIGDGLSAPAARGRP